MRRFKGKLAQTRAKAKSLKLRSRRILKKEDSEKKLSVSQMLVGTWELEIPVSVLLESSQKPAHKSHSTDAHSDSHSAHASHSEDSKSDESKTTQSYSRSRQKQQSSALPTGCLPLPLCQIRSDLTVKLMPLGQDIESNTAIKRYLSSLQVLDTDTVDNGDCTKKEDSGMQTVVRLQLVDALNEEAESTEELTSATDLIAGSYQIKLQVEMCRSLESSKSSSTAAVETPKSESSVTPDSDRLTTSVRSLLIGTLDTGACNIRWTDASQWTKLDTLSDSPMTAAMEADCARVDDESTDKMDDMSLFGMVTPMEEDSTDMTPLTESQLRVKLQELSSQVSVLKEKQNIYKSQAHSSLTQLSDLSRRYDEQSEENGRLKHSLHKTREELEASRLEATHVKDMYTTISEECIKVKDQIVYKKVEESQLKMSELKQESARVNEQLTAQQQVVLSLQDQLQTSQLAARQHIKSIQSLEQRAKEKEKTYGEYSSQMQLLQEQIGELQHALGDAKQSLKISEERHSEALAIVKSKHESEIEALGTGFDETLRANEAKLLEFQSIRNSYAKKNTSLAKDVRRLVQQLEMQASASVVYASAKAKDSVTTFGGTRVSGSVEAAPSGEAVSGELYARLKRENMHLSDELIRKSQSLVDALKAIAELHENAEEETMRIQQSLSHTHFYRQMQLQSAAATGGVSLHAYGGGGAVAGDSSVGGSVTEFDSGITTMDAITDTLQSQIETAFAPHCASGSGTTVAPKMSASMTGLSTASNESRAGSELKPTYSQPLGSRRAKAKVKLAKFRSGFKKSMSDAKHKLAEKKSELSGVSTVKDASLRKAQLEAQFNALQHIANELSATIDQKETAITGLRFANTYLGKRVIVLEKLLEIKPGEDIPDAESLFQSCLTLATAVSSDEDAADGCEETDSKAED